MGAIATLTQGFVPNGRGSTKTVKRVHAVLPMKTAPRHELHQRREAIARRGADETLMDIARRYNVSHSTISRLR